MALAHLLFWLELGVIGLYIGVFMAAFAFGAVSFLPPLTELYVYVGNCTPLISKVFWLVLPPCAQTWPLTVVVTSELWGTKHHGANYLFFGIFEH